MSQDRTTQQKGRDLPQFRSLLLVAAGSNTTFGKVDPREIIHKAVYTLSGKLGVIRFQSALYRSPAFPPGSGPDFVNAVIGVETDEPPERVLEHLHEIERSFGRVRDRRWAPRTLDLDLIAYGNQVLPDAATFNEWARKPLHAQQAEAPETLVLPHPRMQDRAFVLVPLAEITPDWRHPVLGLSVTEMLKSLPKTAVDEVQML